MKLVCPYPPHLNFPDTLNLKSTGPRNLLYNIMIMIRYTFLYSVTQTVVNLNLSVKSLSVSKLMVVSFEKLHYWLEVKSLSI